MAYHVPFDILNELVQATLQKTGLNPSKIDDICVGEQARPRFLSPSLSIYTAVCHPPSPLYISRSAALAAGIPDSVPISTVNRLCSSGLMAIRNIAHNIQSGEISLGMAVGVESMSLKYVHSIISRICPKLLSQRPSHT